LFVYSESHANDKNLSKNQKMYVVVSLRKTYILLHLGKTKEALNIIMNIQCEDEFL